MNICIVGAGAIGGWIAGALMRAGNRVSVLARGETLRLIERDGLLLTHKGQVRHVTPAVSDDPAAIGVQDLLVITVKAPALPVLAPRLKALIGANSVILPMLNGVPWWFTA